MLPANLLNALKAYTFDQRPLPLPVGTADPSPKGPQFELGQKLQGNVQAQVSQGVFKVNVAGQPIQMQLPANIRIGDTIMLQVIANQPRLTFSMINLVDSANPLATPEQLGSAARLLSSMSQQAPEKAYVRAAQSAPLWDKAQPPEGKQLSGLLRETLSNSGLFYESHQAQWLEGTRSTAQLLHEPQNLTPEQAKAVMEGNATGKAAMAENSTGKAVMADAAGKTVVAGDTAGKAAMADGAKTVMMGDTANQPVTANANQPVGGGANASTSSQPGTSLMSEGKALAIPEHLQPLVQQQLNALETRQMVWQGNIWPEQPMQWEVHEQPSQTPGAEEQRQWVTQLRLDLPNLGEVAATLRFNSAGLSLTLNAGTSETRAMLGNASTQLVAALSEVGIPVLSTQVTTI